MSGRGGLVLLTAALLLPGIWAATVTARLAGLKDPGLVVIDEVLGQWVTLAGAAVLNFKSLLAGVCALSPLRHLEAVADAKPLNVCRKGWAL